MSKVVETFERSPKLKEEIARGKRPVVVTDPDEDTYNKVLRLYVMKAGPFRYPAFGPTDNGGNVEFVKKLSKMLGVLSMPFIKQSMIDADITEQDIRISIRYWTHKLSVA